MKIMLLFTYGPISFETMEIFGFSFRQTSPKTKWDQQTKNKKCLKNFYMSSIKVKIINCLSIKEISLR